MRATLLSAVAAFALAPGAGGAAAAEPPAPARRLPIVERAIAHHGGERYRASHTELELCSRSGCYAVGARIEGGLYELDVAGPVREGERRVVASNDEVRLWVDGRPTAVDPGREQGLRDWAMARVYFCFLPYRLGDDSVLQQDLGLEAWGGRELHKVKVTFAPGSSSGADDEFLYWFDPESGRLEQFAYSFRGDPGGLRFRRGFNYRRVGGLLFFDQENLGLDGDGLSVDQITPELVEGMRPVSTVTVEEIRVTALGPAAESPSG